MNKLPEWKGSPMGLLLLSLRRALLVASISLFICAPAPTLAQNAKAQVALVKVGPQRGQLAYFTVGSDFYSNPVAADPRVTSQLADWKRAGKSVKQMSLFGDFGMLLLADDDSWWDYRFPGPLVQGGLISELRGLQAGRRSIDHVMIPQHAVASGGYLVVSGQNAISKKFYSPDQERSLNNLLAQGTAIDAALSYNEYAWAMASDGRVFEGSDVSEGLVSTMETLIRKGERIESIDYFPERFVHTEGGFVIATDKSVTGVDVPCQPLIDSQNWLAKHNRTLKCSEPERLRRPDDVTAVIDLERYRQRAGWEVTDPEPFLVAFEFRARLGPGNQQVDIRAASGIGNIQKGINWAHDGALAEIPAATGNFTFSGVQAYEVFGVITVLVEEDTHDQQHLSDFANDALKVIKGRLERAFGPGSGGTADWMTMTEINAVVENSFAALKVTQEDLDTELFSRFEQRFNGTLSDEDEFGDVDVIAFIHTPLEDGEVMRLFTGGGALRSEETSLVLPGRFVRTRSCCRDPGFLGVNMLRPLEDGYHDAVNESEGLGEAVIEGSLEIRR